MTKKKIVIEFEAGSDFQDETMTKTIMTMLAAFQGQYLGTHKDNKIDITYFPEGDPAYEALG